MHQCEDVVPDAFPMVAHHGAVHHNEHLAVIVKNITIITTRSYAALRAADLGWIVGPGYSLGGYILEKNHRKPTWNHEKQ